MSIFIEPIYQASPIHVNVKSVGGRSDVKVWQHAPGLGQGGKVLPQNLPRSSLYVQHESPSWGAQLGCNGFIVWVSVEVSRHWALNANATCWGLVGGYVLSPHMTLGISARLHAKPMHETNLDWGLAWDSALSPCMKTKRLEKDKIVVGLSASLALSPWMRY